MIARPNPHRRQHRKPATSSFDSTDEPAPEIIIASIQRRQAAIGPNSHTHEVETFAELCGLRCRVVTPFSSFKIVAYPVLALRRLVDLVDKPLGVWWFLRFRRLFLRMALSRTLRRRPAAILYARCIGSAQAALEARTHPDQKVVMGVHFNRSEAEEWRRAGKLGQEDWVYRDIRTLESELLPKLDGLLFVSRFMRDYVHEHHPETAHVQSIVLPNFIADPSPVRRRAPDGDLVSIGTLEPRKNQAYLIAVLREARRLGHRYSLTLIGSGPDRRRLERLAREFGVSDQVRFLGFQRNAARLLPMYRAYVHSALIENFPFVLVEAAAYGLPMLAGPVGGVPEILSDGKQGFHWPLDDPAEGARRLIALLEDEAIYESCAQAARERFEANYSAEIVGPKLLRFLLSFSDRRRESLL